MATDKVRLGLMPPLTGLVGIYGTEIARAGLIACEEVNENGGVLGRQLELVIEDDGSMPESAVVSATKLVDEHRCTAIIGNLLSNSRIAVAYRVAEPRKIPYLNFSFYEGSILSRYFFNFAALPNQQIDKMIPYMCNQYGPRMFFAGNNYEWPRGSIDAGKRILLSVGGQVVGEEYTAIGVALADIDHLLDQVEAAAPDVFVPYFAGADQVNLLTRFTERGMKTRMAVVMGHYDELMASKLTAEVREGFYSSNTYFMTVNSLENKKFLQRLADWPGVTGIWPKGNGILTNFGEGTYVCVKAFARAANLAGTLEPEAMVDAINTLSVSGPQGELRMDPVTHHARVNTYLSRCNAAGEFQIVEYFGAIEPLLPERYNHQRINHKATMEDDIRLQARMLEQMSEAVMLINSHDETILYVNPGTNRLFGYDKDELLGRCLSQLDSESTNIPEISSVLAHKGSWQGEICMQRKDVAVVWVSASLSTFTHPVHGEVWLASFSDITKRKQADDELEHYHQHLQELVAERTTELQSTNEYLQTSLQQLREAQDQLVQSEKMAALGGLVAGIAHEINTPVGVGVTAISHLQMKLQEYKQSYQSGELTRDAFEALLSLVTESSSIISNNLKRAADLIRSFKRVAVDQTSNELRSFDLREYLHEVMQSLKPKLKSASHTVSINCPNGIVLFNHPGALSQVMTNLVMNSIIHGFDGLEQGNITINVKQTENNKILIDYIDDGMGISPENVKKIFEPFFTTRRGQGGTGLGMHIVFNLVNQTLSGRIHCSSTEGEGTVFQIELPGEVSLSPYLPKVEAK